MGTDRRRAPAGRIALLGFITLAVLLMALLFPPFLRLTAHAQVNSPPQFPSEAIIFTIDENTPPYSNIGTPVAAADDNNDELTYSLENAGVSHFGIDSSTGQLRTGTPLDYETRNSYTVKVIATDPSNSSDSVTVTITVNNVDEPGKVTLSWRQPQVGTELEAALTDPDGIVSGPTWQWSQADSKNGNYSDISGATSASYTPEASDTDKFLRATASYTDAEGSGKTARMVSYRRVREEPSDNSAPAFPGPEDIGGGYGCPGTDPDRGVCLYVKRSAPVGARIYQPARAEDPDDDEVRYSLEGTDVAYFDIVASTGELITKQLFRDVDVTPYTVTIKASDPSGEYNTITATIRPSGRKGSPVVEGPDQVRYPANGTWQVATYTAENTRGRIRGWIIGVEPGGGDGDNFDINDDGVLTFDGPPDYEKTTDEGGNQEYSFSIQAYDPNPPIGERPGMTFFSVKVIITGVKEPGPEITVPPEIMGPVSVEYSEDRTDAVATYTVANPVVWTHSGDDAGYFSISNGVLTFNTPPDYEAKSSYSVTVTATDPSNASDSLTVTITVTNVEETPEFPAGETGARSVAENTAADQNIGDPVEAADGDGDSLTYSLGGNDAASFEIVESSGQLLTKDALDYETGPSYSVIVSVSDNKDVDGNADTAVDDTITVTITVTNVEEMPEFPVGETGVRSVAENTEAGENIGGPVAAADDDGDSLTYSLGGTDAASFDIVESSGQLRTKATLDYEAESSYSVTVSVSDNKDAGGNSDTATDDTITVTITVTNVEEAGTVELSSVQPQVDAPLTATLSDPDGGVTGTTWEWESSSDQTDWAAITGATDDSYTPVAGDVDNYLRVTASYTDGEGSGKSAQAVSDNAVQAAPLSNNAPEFSGDSATREIAENTAAGENIGSPVVATDDDDASLTYSLGGTDAKSFDIVASSGQLRTKDALDYEAKSSYSVTVTATDPSDASDSIIVTITVTDVEEAPEFPAGESRARSVAENTAAGRNIGSPVAATDGDGDSLTYSLGGDDAASFDILESSGQLRTKDALDYEAQSSYSVTVSVSDSKDSDGNADTATDATITVTITVTDVDESPPPPAQQQVVDESPLPKNRQPSSSSTVVSFSPVSKSNRTPAFTEGGRADRSVAERTATGTNIGRPVKATDNDGDSLTYSLGGSDAASFGIVGSSGQLLTKDALDYETKSSYSVTVSVSDGKDARGNADKATDDTITVTITVINVEEKPEFPAHEEVVRSVAENTEAGKNIGGPVAAADGDGDSLTYSLGGNDAESFDIVVSSGQLLTKAPLDYEDKSSYSVIVSVSDSKDGRGNAHTAVDDTITVTITVIDVEEAPEFPAGEFEARGVVENTAAGENIGGPVAAAVDGSDGLTYSLGGTDAASFDIVESSGQLLTKDALDYEDKSSYSVIVSVSDGKDARGNTDTAVDDTITVTITVSNEEEAPAFPTGEAEARSVAENTEAGQNIGGPVAAADDDGDSLTYSLGGDDAESFDLVASSGQLLTKDALNYEDKSSYSVIVSVSDNKDAGGNADTATDDTITVTITVTNVEEAPEFPAGETGARTVVENTAAGENIGGPVVATDDDGDSLTYSLGGDDAESFDIVASSGQLLVKATMDYEAESSYSVTVSVSDSKDSGGNADTATDDTITVTITVTNVEETGTVDLSSVQPQVGTTLTTTLSDPDGDVTGTTWKWESSSDRTDWEAISGATEGSYSPVADDVGNYLRVTASYTDEEGSGKSARAVSGNPVRAAPLTNSAPVFSADSATREIAENTAAGENIGNPVVATDDDDDALTYALGGTDAEPFDIVASSGQLRTEASLDYETKSSYSVRVTATDPSSASDSIIVTITVTDVDEPLEAPVSGITDDGDLIGASIPGFPFGGDSAALAAGNARGSASSDVQTTLLPVTATETSLASLVAVIMMMVGAVLIGVGYYLVTREPFPQRGSRPQKRAILSPAFPLVARILK